MRVRRSHASDGFALKKNRLFLGQSSLKTKCRSQRYSDLSSISGSCPWRNPYGAVLSAMTDDTLEPQAVYSPITSSAIFIVATLNAGTEASDTVKGWCADLAGLVRSVGKRVPAGNLSCVCGFSSNAWDRLFGSPRPAALHGFREFGGPGRHAPRPPATCCCTSVPIKWICVSSWPRRSWQRWAMP